MIPLVLNLLVSNNSLEAFRWKSAKVCFKQMLKKKRHENISDSGFNRCCTLKACLEGLHQSTSRDKIRGAFSRAGLVITSGNSPLIIDPQKRAQHLPHPDYVQICHRTSAVYFCVLNCPKFIKIIKDAKDPKSFDVVVKSAWHEIACLKDAITQNEVDTFNKYPDRLPWWDCPLIGEDPNNTFEEGPKRRVSIARRWNLLSVVVSSFNIILF